MVRGARAEASARARRRPLLKSRAVRSRGVAVRPFLCVLNIFGNGGVAVLFSDGAQLHGRRIARRAQRLVIIGNALYWAGLSTPAADLSAFRLLATRPRRTFAGDCVLVWAAYALPTVLAQWPGSMFCSRGLGRGDVWAAGCVTWFYVLVAVNVKLFSGRPRTQRGRRRPMTRAVSSIRSAPRRRARVDVLPGGGVDAGDALSRIPIESPSNPQLWRRIWDYPTA